MVVMHKSVVVMHKSVVVMHKSVVVVYANGRLMPKRLHNLAF